jgi:hypothetical protein
MSRERLGEGELEEEKGSWRRGRGLEVGEGDLQLLEL